jgi:Asp-tRNA(Asn)/Glu-tRNA(Gln) amidotransferase A subunit family amidase
VGLADQSVPPTCQEFTVRSYAEASRHFPEGSSSPVAFLEECLAAIEELEPSIRAFEVLRLEGARAAALASEERWKRGKQLSTIDGMPVGVKDIIETRDMPTQNGSAYFKGHSTFRDAASVQALRGAGAIVLGKTVTTEFAGPFASRTRNPHRLAHTPGGSSSGSAAAVAAGMLPAALGTQVVGSIVRPASYCGTYAIKPTVGTVNRGGSHDGLSQSAHGVLAASLEDAWNVLREIALRVGGDPGHRPLAGTKRALRSSRPRRLGVLRTSGFEASEEYARRDLEGTCRRLAGAGVELLTAEDTPVMARLEAAVKDAQRLSLEIVGYESLWPLRSYLDDDASKLSPLLRERVLAAERRSPEEYAALLEGRDAARRIHDELRGRMDAIITLSATGTAPEGLESTGNTVFNTPASYLGVPAVNLPLFEHDGLPLGLQVVGFAGADLEALCVAGGLSELHAEG